MSLYAFAQAAVRGLTRAVAESVTVEGLENVPSRGPGLIICNHQSFADPPVVQAFCPRPMYSMAKSSQFTDPLVGPLMPRLKAFPAHRYAVDPVAVRTALRHLWSGDLVSIYIEGERSWDGRLQPPRIGTLRLILKAGVPVIPCAVTGTYDTLPRWSHGVRRAPIRIVYGTPLRFGRVDDRAERERRLGDVARAVMGALAHLLGQTDRLPEILHGVGGGE